MNIQVSPELIADTVFFQSMSDIVQVTDTMYRPTPNGESSWRPFVRHEWVKSSKRYCIHCWYTIFDYSRVGPEPPEPEPCDCCYCEGDCNQVEDNRPFERTCLGCNAVEGKVVDVPFYYYRPKTIMDCLCQSMMSDIEQSMIHGDEVAT